YRESGLVAAGEDDVGERQYLTKGGSCRLVAPQLRPMIEIEGHERPRRLRRTGRGKHGLGRARAQREGDSGEVEDRRARDDLIRHIVDMDPAARIVGAIVDDTRASARWAILEHQRRRALGVDGRVHLHTLTAKRTRDASPECVIADPADPAHLRAEASGADRNVALRTTEAHIGIRDRIKSADAGSRDERKTLSQCDETAHAWSPIPLAAARATDARTPSATASAPLSSSAADVIQLPLTAATAG